MIKKLVRHGNSRALIIDRALLEVLHIGEKAEVEVRTDGKSLIITPVRDAKAELAEARRAALAVGVRGRILEMLGEMQDAIDRGENIQEREDLFA